MREKNKAFTFTAWRNDPYTYRQKTSRWTLLKWLIKGEFTLRWLVAVNKKDKRLRLSGKAGL